MQLAERHPAVGRRWPVGRAVGFLISLALLAWVLRRFDLRAVGAVLRTADYSYLLLVAGLILASFGLRAFRWGTLFGDRRAPA